MNTIKHSFSADGFKSHLEECILPFWNALRDDEHGGFYGKVSKMLDLRTQADKGCILQSRIMWFYSNAYIALGDDALLANARHAYDFITKYCMDSESGGIYWSVAFDGSPADTTKHTYNQAFAIYALSSYYAASGDRDALELAYRMMELIESKCTDDGGYLEAFDRCWVPASNEKLSENGVIAMRTMNTLLHVMEAYTELLRVDGSAAVAAKLRDILTVISARVYNPEKRRLEVFFDLDMNPIIDLHSYGHDIEAAWLIGRACSVLGDSAPDSITAITQALEDNILSLAFTDGALDNECCEGEVNRWRMWWVQSEAMVGFVNAWRGRPERGDFLAAAQSIWDFVQKYLIDTRSGSEWFWQVAPDGTPDPTKYLAGEWKCPYHNGRMCLQLMQWLN